MYDSVYINFLSSIPRPLLETFASQVAASNTSNLVTQVYDQYLNFIVTEENLFSCGISGVYHTLNNPTIAETVIEDTVNRIVSSLFSVALTMGIIFMKAILLYRYNANYTVSKGKCRRDDCAAFGWKIA